MPAGVFWRIVRPQAHTNRRRRGQQFQGRRALETQDCLAWTGNPGLAGQYRCGAAETGHIAPCLPARPGPGPGSDRRSRRGSSNCRLHTRGFRYRSQIKRGWSPIPAFSHREPPFCVVTVSYFFFELLFFALFLAPPFFLPPPPFFAVAIASASPFPRIKPYTRCCVLTFLVY